ncbi:hypothetical protein [Saccharomonospora sp. NB11]|jgi:hypothetical protein|uniref:hypothetical protein n=1 Tax=Saccharomonospora sp. NB11 TaxID=1642298 RepID=UPI0018CFFA8C|nr:hypothetical protein [Saccharomonospora sp. NB11]
MTTEAGDLAEHVAQQLAAVVIAALRPDPTSPDSGVDSRTIGAAVERLGTELGSLLRQLEERPARPDDTLPGLTTADSAVVRAAKLARQIMLSGSPDGDLP